MELAVSESLKDIIQAFLLLILPWIVIVIGLVVTFENAWYYMLSITWFGSGIIFYAALH